jgi:hypothetical protein
MASYTPTHALTDKDSGPGCDCRALSRAARCAATSVCNVRDCLEAVSSSSIFFISRDVIVFTRTHPARILSSTLNSPENHFIEKRYAKPVTLYNATFKDPAKYLPIGVQKSYFLLPKAEREILNTAL